MQTKYNEQQEIDAAIRRALDEDIGDGDVTSLSTLPETAVLQGEFVVKENGVLAGLDVARRVFALYDARVTWTPLAEDGAHVAAGHVVARVHGSGRTLLSCERVALNFLQRMSGIATLTRQFVDAVAGTGAVMLDTRKTVPGLRVFDKWAVRLGGGQNHRFGLFDMAMIKDNHIAAVGSLSEAVRRVRTYDARQRPIEVEVTTLAQLREALDLRVDRILLDNMTLGDMREAVQLTAGRTPLEASGNVSLSTVAAIAATGVDFISSGALTHSVKALDISLEIQNVHVDHD